MIVNHWVAGRLCRNTSKLDWHQIPQNILDPYHKTCQSLTFNFPVSLIKFSHVTDLYCSFQPWGSDGEGIPVGLKGQCIPFTWIRITIRPKYWHQSSLIGACRLADTEASWFKCLRGAVCGTCLWVAWEQQGSVWERKQAVHCCCTIQLALSCTDKKLDQITQRLFVTSCASASWLVNHLRHLQRRF